MRTIVSKLIKGIFNVIVPLFYVLFIFAGIACAFVTSLIAYQTVVGLFPKNEVDGFKFIPLFIVISFEVTKVYIIFLNKQYSDSNNAKYIRNKSAFLTLRGLLIVISAIFTLIFTFYNLNNPQLDMVVEQKTKTINATFDQRRRDINSSYDIFKTSIDTSYKKQTKPFEDEAVRQKKITYPDGTYKGPNWSNAIQNVDNKEKEKVTELKKNEIERNEKLAVLEAVRDTTIERAKTHLKTENSSSNKMIDATLEVITADSNYSKGLYLFTIFVLSILITFGLEFVIWGAFTVLAIEHGEFFTSEMKRTTLEQQVQGVTDTANAITHLEIKSMKKRFQDMADTVISLVRKKSKDSINKVKEDLSNPD